MACQSMPGFHAVMPMLNSTGTGSLAVRFRCSRDWRTRRPTSRASRSSASGIATPNSSPPSRPHVSVARTARCSSWASTRIASSPTWWPSVSLISFRLSRSIIISARRPPCRPCGHGAVDRALELRPVGEPGEVVGTGLSRVLARAVERDRDLVGDRGHELQVARLERPGQPGRHRHRAKQHALGAQLGTDRAPLAGDPVDAGLGRAGRHLHHLRRSPERPDSENSSSSPGCMPIVFASLRRAPSRTQTAPACRPSTLSVSRRPTSAISVTSSERPSALAMWYSPCSSVCRA